MSKEESNRKNGLKGGRPKGSTTRPQLRDFMSEEDIQALILKIKTKIEEGDVNMMKWAGDQIFGKAVQPIGNDNGQPLLISFDDAFKK